MFSLRLKLETLLSVHFEHRSRHACKFQSTLRNSERLAGPKNFSLIFDFSRKFAKLLLCSVFHRISWICFGWVLFTPPLQSAILIAKFLKVILSRQTKRSKSFVEVSSFFLALFRNFQFAFSNPSASLSCRIYSQRLITTEGKWFHFSPKFSSPFHIIDSAEYKLRFFRLFISDVIKPFGV